MIAGHCQVTATEKKMFHELTENVPKPLKFGM